MKDEAVHQVFGGSTWRFLLDRRQMMDSRVISDNSFTINHEAQNKKYNYKKITCAHVHYIKYSPSYRINKTYSNTVLFYVPVRLHVSSLCTNKRNNKKRQLKTLIRSCGHWSVTWVVKKIYIDNNSLHPFLNMSDMFILKVMTVFTSTEAWTVWIYFWVSFFFEITN